MMKVLPARVPLLMFALSMFIAGCATTRYENQIYTPGSDPAVESVKSGMTQSNAVKLLSKYILQYVDRKSPKANTSDPFSSALSKNMGAPKVTTNGYVSTDTSVMRIGNRMTVNMKKNEKKFADVTKVEKVYRVREENSRLIKIRLKEADGKVFLVCNVDGSESLVPRVLAVIELLCPNIQGDVSSVTE